MVQVALQQLPNVLSEKHSFLVARNLVRESFPDGAWLIVVSANAGPFAISVDFIPPELSTKIRHVVYLSCLNTK